ncbi:replication/maintenance protein RepL [Rhodocytophaga aerolata]|uniref:Replication/maintenance protein RepL n=1 Tax=Rhodocytophaga aerolata TaxID=455078 RepID=A0ABT8RHF3_9BACT|nr:helix-turn-helix domain-containing protein [Rhodocytophaga aerolata]MDO1451532.1 replication/maintenance protein RepL [Rhodocytophaga aerolata]
MKHEKIATDFQTGEEKIVNDNFIQFYEDNISLIREMIEENPTALKVLLWIIEKMDKNNALVISQIALAESLNVHRNTIGNSISYLKQKKAVEVLKSGSTNIYAVNTEIAWKSLANNKQFALFSAKVYLSSSEQDGDYQTRLFGHVVKSKKKPGRKKLLEAKDFEGLQKKLTESQ